MSRNWGLSSLDEQARRLRALSSCADGEGSDGNPFRNPGARIAFWVLSGVFGAFATMVSVISFVSAREAFQGVFSGAALPIAVISALVGCYVLAVGSQRFVVESAKTPRLSDMPLSFASLSFRSYVKILWFLAPATLALELFSGVAPSMVVAFASCVIGGAAAGAVFHTLLALTPRPPVSGS